MIYMGVTLTYSDANLLFDLLQKEYDKTMKKIDKLRTSIDHKKCISKRYNTDLEDIELNDLCDYVNQVRIIQKEVSRHNEY